MKKTEKTKLQSVAKLALLAMSVVVLLSFLLNILLDIPSTINNIRDVISGTIMWKILSVLYILLDLLGYVPGIFGIVALICVAISIGKKKEKTWRTLLFCSMAAGELVAVLYVIPYLLRQISYISMDYVGVLEFFEIILECMRTSLGALLKGALLLLTAFFIFRDKKTKNIPVAVFPVGVVAVMGLLGSVLSVVSYVGGIGDTVGYIKAAFGWGEPMWALSTVAYLISTPISWVTSLLWVVIMVLVCLLPLFAKKEQEEITLESLDDIEEQPEEELPQGPVYDKEDQTAVDLLDKQLKLGLITQEEYNTLFAPIAAKYEN